MARHKLVIAEKPSVAQSLAAVIGATVRKDGYLEGNGWRVSWCVGHLAVDDPSFLQSFPDGNRVDIVKTILFFFGIEPVLLNKLGKPALYLRPGQLCFLRASGCLLYTSRCV